METLTKLIQPDGSSNEFEGHVHSSIGNFTILTSLDISDNKLQRPIPSSLSQLANLERLLVDGNYLSGMVKLDMLIKFKNLSELCLSDNSFSVITHHRDQFKYYHSTT